MVPFALLFTSPLPAEETRIPAAPCVSLPALAGQERNGCHYTLFRS